jgi:hypothetical protein
MTASSSRSSGIRGVYQADQPPLPAVSSVHLSDRRFQMPPDAPSLKPILMAVPIDRLCLPTCPELPQAARPKHFDGVGLKMGDTFAVGMAD